MVSRFNAGFIALVICLLCIAALMTLFATGSRATAQPMDAHPWHGVAHICVGSTGQEPSCADFSSPTIYVASSVCETDMRARLTRVYELLHSARPDLHMNAQFACIPDMSQLNT